MFLLNDFHSHPRSVMPLLLVHLFLLSPHLTSPHLTLPHLTTPAATFRATYIVLLRQMSTRLFWLWLALPQENWTTYSAIWRKFLGVEITSLRGICDADSE